MGYFPKRRNIENQEVTIWHSFCTKQAHNENESPNGGRRCGPDQTVQDGPSGHH